MKLVAIACVLACAQPALAETRADTLFEKGKKLLAEKKYSEACATFEKVDKLDPGIGAKLNVARCYEDWGKLAKAYRWYLAAQKMAIDSSDKRTVKIKTLVDAIESDVPRLTIKLPPGADATTVKLDTVTAELDKELLVDPGPHLIEYLGKKKPLSLERGQSSEITLDVPKAVVVAPKPVPAQPAVTRREGSPGRFRKIAGIALAGTGLVTLGIAGYVTLDAKSQYTDALDEHCGGVTNMCDPDGVSLTSGAKSRANTATVMAIIGGVAVAGGVVLFVTAPSGSRRAEHALYLAPSLGTAGGGVVFGGGF
ncbi:MAG: tetratricopeptide repeat protein [Kofleriaceae bacterium]